jgi:hypothetical protein
LERQGPVATVTEGRWQDFLERRLVWYGPNLLDRIQLRRGDAVTLLERGVDGWQLLPRGELDQERLHRWLESLRTLTVAEPVDEPPGDSAAVLLLEGPLVAQRQRLEFFRWSDGSGRVRVNGGPLFSLAGDGWEEILAGMDSVRSRRVFPAIPLAQVVWEDGDGVVLWERDGEWWLRIPSLGAVERVPTAVAEEFLRELRHLEWKEEPQKIECAMDEVLSVDGHRLQLGIPRDGQVLAWDGERRMALEEAAVVRLRRLLRGAGSAAALAQTENSQGEEKEGTEQ